MGDQKVKLLKVVAHSVAPPKDHIPEVDSELYRLVSLVCRDENQEDDYVLQLYCSREKWLPLASDLYQILGTDQLSQIQGSLKRIENKIDRRK